MPRAGEYLKLRLGETDFALPSDVIDGILSEFVTAPMPSANQWVYGVLYHQERLIPVIKVDDARAGIAVVCEEGHRKLAYLASEVGDYFTVTPDMLTGDTCGCLFPDISLLEKKLG